MANPPELFTPADALAPRAARGIRQFVFSLIGPEGLPTVLRYASHATVIGVGVATIWLAGARLPERLPAAAELAPPPTATPAIEAAATPAAQVSELAAPPPAAESVEITRQIDPHTTIPTRPRQEVVTYTVQSGDSLFGIAAKFNLTPETILWGNFFTLKDDPHSLRPGQILNILPVNGALHVVQPGDRLEVIARFFRVTLDDIVSWPANNLDPVDPQVTAGQALIIPGGTREFVQWAVPRITRTSRNVLPRDAGAGACPGGYSGGAVGSGSFVWPSANHWLSGNNWSSFHAGIDIAAGLGEVIWAADNGVVVYAGPNNYGYGNMVVIDHGNGWQTLYGHLSQWNVVCGQSIYQGQIVGLAGSTGRSSGPHLHLETQYQGGRVNPWNVLPPP